MATVTITIPDEQVQRVRDAFTYALGIEAPAQADLADLQTYIVRDLKQFVRGAERGIAREAIQANADVDFS